MMLLNWWLSLSVAIFCKVGGSTGPLALPGSTTNVHPDSEIIPVVGAYLHNIECNRLPNSTLFNSFVFLFRKATGNMINNTESAPDNNSTIANFSASGFSVSGFSASDSDPYVEMAITIFKIVIPILFLLGNVGNITSFVILRTGELKKLSTCFYMSVLAVVDTGKTYSFDCVKYSHPQRVSRKIYSVSVEITNVCLHYDCFGQNFVVSDRI